MRKEVLIAIIAGSTMGLIIAFGAWKANSLLSQKTKIDNSIQINPTPSPESNQELKVIIQKPENMSVQTDTPIVVSGITNPNSWVVVSGIDGDNIINASSSGSFTTNIDLEGGANQIVVSAFDQNENEAKKDLTIVYSSQFQPQTTSGDAIAYIGTVTDISNSTIQIKNNSGDIEQIEGQKNASFIDTRNNETKAIKESDIAIGDFLIAMGYKDGNNILLSSRIIVTDALTKTIRRAFEGIVTDDSGINKFVAKNPKTNETVTVTPATGITITGAERSFGKISNNEKVIAVGEFKDGTLAARTIEVLK